MMESGTHTVVLRHPGRQQVYRPGCPDRLRSRVHPARGSHTKSAATGSNNGQVKLDWNAPGDDDMTGTATSYIVRYAAAAIDTQAKWDAATNVSGEPAPLAANTAQTMTISGLDTRTDLLLRPAHPG